MPVGTGDGQYFDDEFHYQAERPVRKASDEASMTHQAEAPPDKVQRFVKDTTQSIADTLTAGPRLMQDFMEGKTSSDDPEAIRRSTDVASSTMGLGMLGAEKNALGMFGGRMSPSSVRYAEHMEKSGFPANDIKELTGLERGADDMWRREFSDKDAKLNLDAFPTKDEDKPSWTSVSNTTGPTQEGTAKLGDILKHDKLYEVYPDAKDIDIRLGHRPGSSTGAYLIDDNSIYLRSGRDPEQIKSTLLHEIQHWIQHKEGFSLTNLSLLNPEMVDKTKGYLLRTYSKDDIEGLLKDLRNGDADTARKKAQALLDSADHTVYRNQATEVEARNTQARVGMSDYQRRKTLGLDTEDVDRSEQIIQERDRMEDFLKRANAQRKQEQQGRRIGDLNETISKDYYDKIPQEQRLARTGISHPGYRWEVYDRKTGAVQGEPYMNKSKATSRVDKLDNNYGAIKYNTRPVKAKDIDSTEQSMLDKFGIKFED